MKWSKFSEEQVAYTLRQAEGGTPVGDVCRQLGVSQAKFCTWKKKYGHLGVSEFRPLRQLEGENARLKRVVLDLTLDKTHPHGDDPEKPVTPTRRRERTRWIQDTFQVAVAGHVDPAMIRVTRKRRAALRDLFREAALVYVYPYSSLVPPTTSQFLNKKYGKHD